MAKYDKMSSRDAMNAAKRDGMSERDAALISMKIDKKDKDDSPEVSPAYSEDYPYGLRIDLNEDSLELLGIDSLPDVGDTMKVVAEATVERVEQNSSSSGKHRSVCMQITAMKIKDA